MSDITAKCELPWYYPQDPNWTKAEWHIMVWCGAAHAHVDISSMFWTGTSHHDFPHFILGYEDEEPAQPSISSADELADWAKLLTWLNAQPWPEWSLPDVTNSDTVES
jgi:DNA polymerase IIIc chi subunit